jgi:FixJ family two-component response regulator
MSEDDRIVFIVDDDKRVCEGVCELLMSIGLPALAFNSAADYIAFVRPDVPACLVLDVELPDINGLDLQHQIAAARHPPIVFITGHGDIPSSVRAMKRGAVDFLTKPFSEAELMAAIHTAIAQDRQSRRERDEMAALRERFASLTPRERPTISSSTPTRMTIS